MKVAVTALLPVMLITVGLAVPEASPLQFAKLQPMLGIAVSVTFVPQVYVAWLGLLLTDPLPLVVIVRVHWSWVKVAVTDTSPVIVKVVGFADPDRPPPQTLKPQPTDGTAANCTASP